MLKRADGPRDLGLFTRALRAETTHHDVEIGTEVKRVVGVRKARRSRSDPVELSDA